LVTVDIGNADLQIGSNFKKTFLGGKKRFGVFFEPQNIRVQMGLQLIVCTLLRGARGI